LLHRIGKVPLTQALARTGRLKELLSTPGGIAIRTADATGSASSGDIVIPSSSRSIQSLALPERDAREPRAQLLGLFQAGRAQRYRRHNTYTRAHA